MLGRYSALTVDNAAFTAGLAAVGASRDAKSFTIGANWYPAQPIKIYITYERTTFGAAGAGTIRPAENVFLYRTQLGF